jgi:hypothetical protein
VKKSGKIDKEDKYTGDPSLESEMRTLNTQRKSREWFAKFQFRLTQFKGLAGFSQLLFEDETLAEWREGVDKVFSSLYLGTDYWASGVCAKYIPKDQKGLLTMKTKDGLFDVVAHAEGEKTTITKPDGTTEYLYKLTFSVRNPKDSRYDKLEFNVFLYGDQTIKLYPEDVSVDEGDSFTRGAQKGGETEYSQQHGKPIVQYSPSDYNKICIEFKQGIINAEGNSENEVCNAIVEYTGTATGYQEGATATSPTTPGSPQSFEEADF